MELVTNGPEEKKNFREVERQDNERALFPTKSANSGPEWSLHPGRHFRRCQSQ